MWPMAVLMVLLMPYSTAASEPAPLCGADDSGTEFIAVDVAPELISKAAPEYPAEAKAKGIQGKVIISSRVEIDGTVSGQKVTSSSGSPLLDAAALAAAGKYRFKPAVQDGKPVTVWVSFAVDFALEAKSETPSPETFRSVDNEPEIIKQIEPAYPAGAYADKITGKVFVQLFVDVSGKVTQAKVSQSSGNQLLDDAAVEAGRKFEFKPATKDGHPVGVWVSLPFVFALE